LTISKLGRAPAAGSRNLGQLRPYRRMGLFCWQGTPQSLCSCLATHCVPWVPCFVPVKTGAPRERTDSYGCLLAHPLPWGVRTTGPGTHGALWHCSRSWVTAVAEAASQGQPSEGWAWARALLLLSAQGSRCHLQATRHYPWLDHGLEVADLPGVHEALGLIPGTSKEVPSARL
jgi:hypothetical protein